jgi:hypothetical protein
MLICTSWKTRPVARDQADRMRSIWGKMEADLAENTSVERLCWFINVDGTGGFAVNRVKDADAAMAFSLEIALSMGEFIELDTRPVLDLEAAMPAITNSFERSKG